MKKFNLAALIAGAMLFMTMGVTSLSAEMKCGAGKCGAAMEKPKCCNTPGGELKAPACKVCKAVDCKCDPAVKCTCKDTTKCTCDTAKKAPAAPKEAMKCGTGKCG